MLDPFEKSYAGWRLCSVLNSAAFLKQPRGILYVDGIASLQVYSESSNQEKTVIVGLFKASFDLTVPFGVGIICPGQLADQALWIIRIRKNLLMSSF